MSRKAFALRALTPLLLLSCAASATFTDEHTVLTTAIGNASTEAACQEPTAMGDLPGSSTRHPCVRVSGGEASAQFLEFLTTLPGAIIKGILGSI